MPCADTLEALFNYAKFLSIQSMSLLHHWRLSRGNIIADSIFYYFIVPNQTRYLHILLKNLMMPFNATVEMGYLFRAISTFLIFLYIFTSRLGASTSTLSFPRCGPCNNSLLSYRHYWIFNMGSMAFVNFSKSDFSSTTIRTYRVYFVNCSMNGIFS